MPSRLRSRLTESSPGTVAESPAERMVSLTACWFSGRTVSTMSTKTPWSCAGMRFTITFLTSGVRVLAFPL